MENPRITKIGYPKFEVYKPLNQVCAFWRLQEEERQIAVKLLQCLGHFRLVLGRSMKLRMQSWLMIEARISRRQIDLASFLCTLPRRTPQSGKSQEVRTDRCQPHYESCSIDLISTHVEYLLYSDQIAQVLLHL